MKRLIPKVLIAAPVSERHKHLLNEWIKHLDSLSYPNFDVCLIDTTLKHDRYFDRISKKKLGSTTLQFGDSNQKVKFNKKIITLKHRWDPNKLHPVQMLAHAREKVRKYFLKKDYKYLFWLDDDIFIPQNGIQKLISHKKDQVGFYVHVFPKGQHRPCILKGGEIIFGKGREYFSFAEIDEYKRFVKKFKENKLTLKEKHLVPFMIQDKLRPQLFKAYGVGIGCLLCSRKVVEAIPFRTHPTFVDGEDLWYFAESNEKGFDFWCDTSVRPRHENTEWDSVVRSSKRDMGFAVAHGPVDAKGIDIIDRRKKG